MITIGIDLGGTRIKTGLVQNGNLLDVEMMPAHSGLGLEPQLAGIKKTILRLLAKNSINSAQLDGVGMTFPGIVDNRQMRIISTIDKYADATEIDLKAWISEHFSVPFAIDNDARVGLLGEWQYGAGIGIDDLVMVTLGTGVGGAALMNGRLVRGKHFVAGCLGGHFSINYQGTVCQCGNIGCVETEASSWRLPAIAAASEGYENSGLASLEQISYEEVFKLSDKGDQLARKIIDHSIHAWSIGIVNMIHAYDPERVIVGGGIIKHNAGIIERMQEIVDRHAWTPWGQVAVVKEAWPERNAILGCECLIKLHLKNS